MKNIKIIFLCVLASFAFWACSDDEEPTEVKVEYLALLTDSVRTLDSTGQLLNIKFQSPGAWEVVDVDSSDIWYELYPLAGDANSKKVVSVNASANDKAFEDRSAMITIKSGADVIKTRILQKSALPDPILEIQFDVVPGGAWLEQRIGRNGDGWSWKDDVTCNGPWTIVDKDPWLMIRAKEWDQAPEISGGFGNLKLHIYAKPNTGPARDGKFTVKAKNLTRTITVRQWGV